jgi:hypothetical protein
MASQAQLEADIDLATAQVASLELQLDAAAGSPQPDPAVIGDLERQLATAKNALSQLQTELNNLLVASDPNTNVGAEAQLVQNQQTIDPNNDPNTNTGNETEQQPRSQQFIDPNTNPNEGAVEGTTEEIQRQRQAEADARQDDEAYQASLQQYIESEPPSSGGSQGALNETRSVATNQDAVSFEKAKDWRVRLSLAPSAKYLYRAGDPGILKPLAATNGVIFPYTPNVSVVYAANYDASELIHSNYKIYNYKNSAVDTVSITCDFTAQDTTEANYLLAVIHFFRSVTKMFYGRDENPRNGTPPPLCYLSGLGTFQFDNHPLVVSNFTYTLPTDVDYIRVGSQTNQPGQNVQQQSFPVNTQDSSSLARILSSGLGARTPNFQRQASSINSDATYVPTKMQIALTCIPIVTRNDISNNFSLKKYATGELLQGSKRNGGGIW